MTPAPLHFHGEKLLLDPDGALYWPAERLLMVADLHLEKGSACAARGQLVPPWDSRLTLDRLERVADRYRPAIVAALGDSFHDGAGSRRLAAPDRARLAALAGHASIVWVLGNHDRTPPDLPGVVAKTWTQGPLTLRHEAVRGACAEVSGHYHPKARVATRAATVSRPCFLAGPDKIMLPAFGAYTGGLDIRAPAIAAHFPRGGRAFLLGRDRLFSFALEQVRTGPGLGTGAGKSASLDPPLGPEAPDPQSLSPRSKVEGGPGGRPPGRRSPSRPIGEVVVL